MGLKFSKVNKKKGSDIVDDFENSDNEEEYSHAIPPPALYATPEDIQYPTTGGIRFKVHDVEIATNKGPFLSNGSNGDCEKALRKSWSTLGKVAYVSPIDTIDSTNGQAKRRVISTFKDYNNFAYCVHECFFSHYPLRITPDTIWITILQGLAIHVDKNHEKLRHCFVNFNGKEEIRIFRPDITVEQIKHSIDTQTNGTIPWHETIDQFTDGVKQRVKSEVHPLIECTFSTSTLADRISKHVALLEITKHYFELVMECGCGIPWIELLGTPEDWQLLYTKASNELSKYDLDWWLKGLLPVLQEFVNSSQGKVNLKFWRAVVYMTGGSGMRGDPITGWLQALFPYLSSGEGDGKYYKNKCLMKWKEDSKCTAKISRYGNDDDDDDDYFGGRRGGISLDSFPSGTSQAKFTVADIGTQTSMQMLYGAGLVAITYDEESHALEVHTGYAVMETPSKDESFEAR